MSFATLLFVAIMSLHLKTVLSISASLNTTNIVLSNLSTLTTDPYFSSAYPSDYLTYAAFTPTSIWTLSLNNTVQILDKNNLSLTLNAITETSSDFQFQSTVPLSMIIFNEDYSIAAITGYVNSSFVCYLYDYTNTSFPVLTKTINIPNTPSPSNSLIAGSTLYIFFSNSNISDTIMTVKLLDSNTVTTTLPSSGSSIAWSPNRKYAVLLNKNYKAQIYSIPAFTLLYTYYVSVTVGDSVSFSTDGNLALIISDNHYRFSALNLTDFSVFCSISPNGIIQSSDFLDANSRYILITQGSKTEAYDTQLNISASFDSVLQIDSLLVDHSSSKMIVTKNNVKYLTSVSVSSGNLSLSGSSNDSTATNATSNSTTNTTDNVTGNSTSNATDSNITANGTMDNNTATNSTNSTQSQLTNSSQDATIAGDGMSYLLDISSTQSQAFTDVQSASRYLLKIMTYFNLTVFSSPFVCFFLGFFNYFTLGSLYILLNIQLPDIVFKELSAIYATSNANLISSLGFSFSLAPITSQLVDSHRALYFGISSDLLSFNYYSIGLVIVNSLLFELIQVMRTRLSKNSLLHSLLDFNRHKIYFGLAVYLMVGLFLPSQFVMIRRLPNLPTTINSLVQCLLYVVVTQFLWSSLIEALKSNKTKKGKKAKQESKIKRQWRHFLPEWMMAFQNLVYPLLVLLPNPSFFLAAVLISKSVQISVFSKHSRQRGLSRILQICSFICQVIYHFTFIIFFLTQRQEIIVYNSLFCLLFFYLGVIINLAWTFLFFINLLKKIATVKKQTNRVVDQGLPLTKHSAMKKKRDLLSKKIQKPIITKIAFKLKDKAPVKIGGQIMMRSTRKAISRVDVKKKQTFTIRVVDV